MDWKNLPRSGNIEDDRGNGGGGGRGGIPGGGVAIGGGAALIIALLGWFFGVDTSGITGGGQTQGQSQTQSQSQTQGQAQTQGQSRTQQNSQGGATQDSTAQGGAAQGGTDTSNAPTDQFGELADRVLGSTQQVWGDIFRQQGKTYTPAKLVLFSGSIGSACGQASSASGPFYCPSDKKVYLDTNFFNEMKSRLGGGGDFAYSYVIAHEVGHHVQDLLGISEQVDRAERSARSEAQANTYSVKLELQADCFAGVWGKRSEAQTNLTQDDVRNAINTATAIGDDTLQRESRGTVTPDSFTHGSSAQRVGWFERGFKNGNPSDCDTFKANTSSP